LTRPRIAVEEVDDEEDDRQHRTRRRFIDNDLNMAREGHEKWHGPLLFARAYGNRRVGMLRKSDAGWTSDGGEQFRGWISIVIINNSLSWERQCAHCSSFFDAPLLGRGLAQGRIQN
jgi:hypothetical protein